MRTVAVAWTVMVLLICCMSVSSAASPFTLDFEGIPITYETTNLGDYYASLYGVYFSPSVRVLDGNANYPAHSGTSLVWSYPDNFFDMTLDTPAYSVDLWYTSSHPVYLKAYDAADALLDSVSGFRNISSSNQLTVANDAGRISRVRLHDGGPYFTVDDVTILPTDAEHHTPEPATLILLGCSGLVVGVIRRRRAA